MQGFIALFAIWWIVTTPWALITLGLLVTAVIGFIVWDHCRAWAPMSRLHRFSNDGLHGNERSFLARRIGELEAALAEARQSASALRARNTALQRRLNDALTEAERSSSNRLYRRVGLDPDAPEWVVAAVRRAYRAKLHPDRFSPRIKVEAERRFKDAEAVFDEINARQP